MNHLVYRSLRFVFVLIFLLAAGLFFIQGDLIYFPRVYTAEQIERARETVTVINFFSSEGPQQVYYLAPPSGQKPKALWICFHGNAGAALNWLGYLKPAGLQESGFLMVDYPGFGASKGAPSPETILEVSNLALAALGRSIGLSQEELAENLNVLGVSLGSAAALQFAAVNDTRRVILLAPFTSMFDMARLHYGRPLAYLVRHNFDNQARLAELSSRTSKPQVSIFHGTADRTIPVWMGRKLAQAQPALVKFVEIPNCDHNDILGASQTAVFKILAEAQGAP